jgi:single-strand DNA-binding protein
MYHRTEIIGRVGKDVEVRYTTAGQAVANFSVAVTEKFKDKEHTTWYSVQVWGKLAEIAGEYVVKGMLIFVEGRMNEREWEDRDGNKRRSWELIGNTMKFLSGKKGGDAAGSSSGTDAVREEPPFVDDSIPF